MATDTDKRWDIEVNEKWREAIQVIPFIQFPADWKIQIIPPFSGAMARFRVTLPSGKTRSVYLDFFNRLGFYSDPPEPYWEVYPYRGDTGRCDMQDIATLLGMIEDETDDATL